MDEAGFPRTNGRIAVMNIEPKDLELEPGAGSTDWPLAVFNHFTDSFSLLFLFCWEFRAVKFLRADLLTNPQ